jgi:hypothetical protein
MNFTLTLDERELRILLSLLSMHGISDGNPKNDKLDLPEGADDCYDIANLQATILDQIDNEAFERALATDEAADRALSDEGSQMTDVEADADTLASAGMGTDEDYRPEDVGDRY